MESDPDGAVDRLTNQAVQSSKGIRSKLTEEDLQEVLFRRFGKKESQHVIEVPLETSIGRHKFVTRRQTETPHMGLFKIQEETNDEVNLPAQKHRTR